MESWRMRVGQMVVWVLLWACVQQLPAQGPEFLHRLGTKAEFDQLKGKPLSAKYGQVESVKVVWDLNPDKLYFVSGAHYEWHYDFCHARLGYWQSNYLYNQANYSDSPNRRYALANLNHLLHDDSWHLEFSSADQIPIDLIVRLQQRVIDSSFVGENIAIFANTTRLEEGMRATTLPVLLPADLYGSLQYQPLNCKVGYGYLRRVPVDSLEAQPPGATDIVVLDGPALDITVVAGLMSPEFQTPLSHLNVLCKNRGTPFLAQKGIWEDPRILAMEDKLVRFTVFQDSFSITPASLTVAQTYWDAQRPTSVNRLKMNIKVTDLQSMDRLSLSSVKLVGGKAANFSVLSRLSKLSDAHFKVPEGAFAIPFYWYWRHFEESGARVLAEALLRDRARVADAKALNKALAEIRAKMEAWPVNRQLISMVEARSRKESPTLRMRFRSSTNAEDIPGFNGAGLYESRTGVVGDSVRTVENAIREVWASLWNFRAFQEREFYRIDHMTCAMGLLAHRSFPDEAANGVAITKNLYRPDYYGFVINVQIGETSVVSPPPGVTCDQIICYSDSDVEFYARRRIVEYIARSSLTQGAPVLSETEVIQLTTELAAIKKYYYSLQPKGYVEPGLVEVAMEKYNAYGLDVEFKFDGASRTLYIKQVRPYQD